VVSFLLSSTEFALYRRRLRLRELLVLVSLGMV
jgi:hypothetical protein